MTVITEDGVRLWAARSGVPGSTDPLMLCHGGPGLWDMFEDVAAMFEDRTTVIRWDQRGCGRSERCDGPWTTERFVADLDAVRRHFGLDRTALLGHSWGAQLALSYTLAHPERVSTLVYVSGNGIGPVSDWHAAYKANLASRLDGQEPPEGEREQVVLQWSADFADRERALERARRMADPWFEINYVCNSALTTESRRAWGTPELRAACRDLDVPVLIVDGAEDIRPRSAVDSLAEALPRVRRTVLPGTGHVPWAESPDAFRVAVTGALTAGP
ncbi:alpha/beta fold hydrolase [Streptomyces griseorubiginosus]|uniref:alpha/beta fold hydrolase n=1 Tax=Streptomyces griseorubiginosus TaxID=67304 RepID=UPI00076D2974|nr:alpha/beta hydrolase [Streptomyces griseorubiginosus]KUM74023.1 alpha/beta hydrolase [Streptomyces griseorubiginosus]